jgi:molybdopterin converting factor small subunit
MQIEVRLFATFRRWLPASAQGSRCQIEVADGSDIGRVLSQLGVPIDQPEHMVILLNGRPVGPGHPLKPGDVLSAFPAMEGG